MVRIQRETTQKTAFFIDDDEDFLDAIRLVVAHPGFKIQTYLATNGYQAIDEVLRRKPDVLFIDFNLPRANGGQILSVLRAVKVLSGVPVYFITGHDKADVKPHLAHVDYDGILQKGDRISEDIVEALNRT